MCSKESIGKMPLFQRNTSNTSLFRVFLATSYVKLKQAYISESTMMGNWGIIGYKGPGEETTASGLAGGAVSGTTNFTYKDANDFTNNTAALTSGGKTGWTAGNKQRLNDCPNADNWTITVKQNGSTAGEAKFEAEINATNSVGCTALTPNFTNIGK